MSATAESCPSTTPATALFTSTVSPPSALDRVGDELRARVLGAEVGGEEHGRSAAGRDLLHDRGRRARGRGRGRRPAAPSAANSRAIALPIPEVDPVTSARSPCNRTGAGYATCGACRCDAGGGPRSLAPSRTPSGSLRVRTVDHVGKVIRWCRRRVVGTRPGRRCSPAPCSPAAAACPPRARRRSTTLGRRSAEAQQAADAAAARYEEAIGRLEQLGADIEDRKARIAAGKQEAAELSVLAERRAVTAYIGRDTLTDGSFLIEGGDPLDEVRRQKLLARTKEEEDDAVDRLVELNQDLAHEQRQLELQRTEQDRRGRSRWRRSRPSCRRSSRRRSRPSTSSRSSCDERRRQLARVSSRQPRHASASNRDNGKDYTGAYVSTGIVCPVQGAVSFIDSWGAPRHQGAHQGVDLMAATGTPNVAVVSGDVTFKEGGTSGLGAYLHGDDGNLYYYFHLSAYEGGARHVSQGEVIGYVGNTGDARYTAPHTHFEIHPGGGAAVNPYPSVAAVC